MMNIFKVLDVNLKLKEDYVSELMFGVIIILVCAALCLILFFGEFFLYKMMKIVSELRVNLFGVY